MLTHSEVFQTSLISRPERYCKTHTHTRTVLTADTQGSVSVLLASCQEDKEAEEVSQRAKGEITK